MAFVRQHPDYPKFRMKIGVMPDFSGSNYANQEIPTGIVDGTNKVFTLIYKPIQLSETMFKDGMFMARASSLALTDGDYFIDYSTSTITFSDKQIPQAKSVILVSYKYL